MIIVELFVKHVVVHSSLFHVCKTGLNSNALSQNTTRNLCENDV